MLRPIQVTVSRVWKNSACLLQCPFFYSNNYVSTRVSSLFYLNQFQSDCSSKRMLCETNCFLTLTQRGNLSYHAQLVQASATLASLHAGLCHLLSTHTHACEITFNGVSAWDLHDNQNHNQISQLSFRPQKELKALLFALNSILNN